MKTILVPTDFSKNSLNAVEYAAALAKKENARIILLNAYHFVPPPSNLPLPADVIHSMRINSINRLEMICSEIIRSKKIKCEYISKFNLAVPAILEASKEKKVELVVMGTKGASGMKEILMGSIAASVIERATCPVIIVPEGAVFSGIKKILYASDYHESDIDALRKLAGIAKLFGSTITVLHASDEEFNRFSEETYLEEFRRKVKRRIRYENIFFKLAVGKLLEKVIRKEVSEMRPDLLAMSTRHRSLVEKLFTPSVTKKMVYHTDISLMVFHHKKESAVFI